MTREEVKFQFTGMAHDHLIASSRVKSVNANTLHHHHLNNRHQPSYNATQSQQQQQQQQQQQPLQSTFGRLNSIQDQANIPAQRPRRQMKVSSEECFKVDNDSSPTMPTTTTTATNGLSNEGRPHPTSALSTIAILRRHPMYDSLVLVKKYRSCLNGYTLEFPTSNVDGEEADSDDDNHHQQHHHHHHQHHHNNNANGRQDGNSINKMVSSQLMNSSGEDTAENGDCASKEYGIGCGRTKLVSVYLDGDDPIYQCQAMNDAQKRGGTMADGAGGNNFMTSEGGDIVYVPINGLLDRLDNYDQQGISIDSRVYAFAMGLKTAERFLTSSSEKEIQEAPPL